MNYKTLTPGFYFQRGDAIKSISSLNNILGMTAAPSADSLAASVSWVFIALEKRADMIAQVFAEWQTRGEATPMAYKYRIRTEFARADQAVQLHGVAYWHKLRNASGRVIELRWLDPRTMTPAYTPAGITHYKRTMGKGAEVILPAEDVIRVVKPGLAEQEPGLYAGISTQAAAEVLYYLAETNKSIYANNAVPPMLVHVPPGTSEAQKSRIKAIFDRLTNRRMTATEDPYRYVPVSKDVTFTPLAISPKDLASKDMADGYRDIILGAHGVPLSEALGNAANFATADSDHRKFIVSIGSRMDMFADAINEDEDIAKQGASIFVGYEQHADLQRDELAVSQAMINYSGLFTAQASAHLVGIHADDFPANIGDPFRAAPVVIEPEPVIERVDIDLPSATRAALADLAKWQTKASRKAGADFESDFIPQAIAETVTAGLAAGEEVKAVFGKARRALVAAKTEADNNAALLEAVRLGVEALKHGRE